MAILLKNAKTYSLEDLPIAKCHEIFPVIDLLSEVYMYTVQLYIFRVSQSMQPGNHIAVAAREMKRKEGRDDACPSAPSACLPGCCRPCALLPSRRRRRRSQALQREPTIRPSVRPPDGRKRVTHAHAEPPRRQQQLEQQKQALWRLAQPGGRTETAEPWPTPIAFSTTLLVRLVLTFRHVPKYQNKQQKYDY